MTAPPEPRTRNLAELYDLAPLAWPDVRRRLETNLTPPWYVYELTPEDVYAVATQEPGGATRWTF